MANESLRELVKHGLQAAKTGIHVARQATSDIQNSASNAQLKEAIQAGNQHMDEWSQRVDRAISEVGSAQETGNQILQAQYDVSKRIRDNAPDQQSRDLGIIAAAQMALHYWIASFGTLRTYASSLGMMEAERNLQQCMDDAKRADQNFTKMAEEMLKTGTREMSMR